MGAVLKIRYCANHTEAVSSSPASLAGARILVHIVDTRRPSLARTARTLVNVCWHEKHKNITYMYMWLHVSRTFPTGTRK